jgi:hypothetical protein
MGIDPKQLLTEVIRPTLLALGLNSFAAERLVLATAAHESHCGRYLRQVKGPALGIYQMEPLTHDDIVHAWLKYQKELGERVYRLLDPPLSAPRLVYDLRYATALCRLHYRRCPAPLPDADDWQGIAEYWKKHYNTTLGKGTCEAFLADCRTVGVQRVV